MRGPGEDKGNRGGRGQRGTNWGLRGDTRVTEGGRKQTEAETGAQGKYVKMNKTSLLSNNILQALQTTIYLKMENIIIELHINYIMQFMYHLC